MTIAGERTKQLDIFCHATGVTSDFLSFIDVALIRFFHGAIQSSRGWSCVHMSVYRQFRASVCDLQSCKSMLLPGFWWAGLSFLPNWDQGYRAGGGRSIWSTWNGSDWNPQLTECRWRWWCLRGSKHSFFVTCVITFDCKSVWLLLPIDVMRYS